MRKFVIHEIVPPQPLLKRDPISLKEQQSLWTMDGKNKLEPMKILVSSGPYFRDDSVHVSLMDKVGEAARKSCANAIFLLGPFLPPEN